MNIFIFLNLIIQIHLYWNSVIIQAFTYFFFISKAIKKEK